MSYGKFFPLLQQGHPLLDYSLLQLEFSLVQGLVDVYKRQTLLDEEFLLLAIVSTSVMNLRFEYRNPIVCKWGENMMVNVGKFLR